MNLDVKEQDSMYFKSLFLDFFIASHTGSATAAAIFVRASTLHLHPLLIGCLASR